MKRDKQKLLSTRKRELFKFNSRIIKYWRNNPVQACYDLLGINLLDEQKYLLQHMWVADYSVLCASRNFGKSFIIAVYVCLKFLLFENQKIYIMSSVGSQAQETFLKVEDIALDRLSSIKSLKDIFKEETVKNPGNKTGFGHNPASFSVTSYNNSYIKTLNGDPDNNRSKRASLVIFDEAGFCSEELLAIGLAFITQDSEFVTSTDESFNLDLERIKCPTQAIYASSASDIDTTFFRKYKEYSMKMFMGDRRYFVADIPCDIPTNPHMDGKPHPPLLKKEQIEAEMRINREKALREYYNRFTTDGGESQMIKRATIIRNSVFDLPILTNENNKDKFAIAFDPARTGDGSCISVMRICHDDNIGYYGEIVNCVNLIDLGKKKKMNMKSTDQAEYLKQLILDYNGNALDYENISCLMIDAGAGGGGVTAYSDHLLEDWNDKKGIKHKGFIDAEYEIYKEEVVKYPNASKILSLISPNKYKTQMCEELIELMNMDLIRFPKEYNGKGYLMLAEDKGSGKEAERDLVQRKLTMEEEIALINIDAMKSETTTIHKIKSGDNVSYKIPKDKERTHHDDRFYTLLLLAHHLYELRRKDILRDNVNHKKNVLDYCLF